MILLNDVSVVLAWLILDRADSDPKIKVKEILHIDKKKSSLNIQINSQTEFRYNVNPGS